MNHFERQVLDEGNCEWATLVGRKPARMCVNAGFVNRHPDIFTSKLQGYEQKLRIRPDRSGE